MKRVLHIITSPRGETSASRKLGNAVIEKIKAKYPDTVTKERDLTKNFPHLDELAISLRHTPVHLWSPEQKKIASFSEELIAELVEADFIVIDSPMYNYTITSTLKAYFDYTVISGKTFRITQQGDVGLLKDKRAYIAFSSGYVFSEGVYAPMDFNTQYLKAILNFIGITDVGIFRAEGLVFSGNNALLKGIKSIKID